MSEKRYKQLTFMTRALRAVDCQDEQLLEKVKALSNEFDKFVRGDDDADKQKVANYVTLQAAIWADLLCALNGEPGIIPRMEAEKDDRLH